MVDGTEPGRVFDEVPDLCRSGKPPGRKVLVYPAYRGTGEDGALHLKW